MLLAFKEFFVRIRTRVQSLADFTWPENVFQIGDFECSVAVNQLKCEQRTGQPRGLRLQGAEAKPGGMHLLPAVRKWRGIQQAVPGTQFS